MGEKQVTEKIREDGKSIRTNSQILSIAIKPYFWRRLYLCIYLCDHYRVVTVAAAPLVLATVGFTTAGITAGSTAAAMMSSAAVANGGGIAVGSLVATLQSAGGLFWLLSVALSGVISH
uniref:Uncharacterized protein n=1 Tax=Astyanax mexicanus TaxID=7994 RepID=A0A8B9GL69_ASTMX